MLPRIATQLIHAGRTHIEGAVVHPIFQSANYLQDGAGSYGAVRYQRMSNTPQQLALAEKLAAIEQAEAALAVTSGMAAISTTLLSMASAGDHLLLQDNLYGGTHTLVADLRRLGIEVGFFNATRPESLETHLRSNTKAIYVEAISNPLLEVPALGEIIGVARARGVPTVIDATFVSPVGFRPLPFGFDIVVHSATKYLNGHSDVIAGTVAGSRAHIDEILALQHHLGCSLDAHACFLLDRGLKTLALRVPRQSATALSLAELLADHPKVMRVRYPGLPSDPSHARASRAFRHFGGMVSFAMADAAAAERVLGRLKIPVRAASLGGLESLVVMPARSSHLGLTAEERASRGISDGLIRVSVGVEDPEDLLADFARALD